MLEVRGNNLVCKGYIVTRIDVLQVFRQFLLSCYFQLSWASYWPMPFDGVISSSFLIRLGTTRNGNPF